MRASVRTVRRRLPAPAAAREQRKTVTAVFCDVVGSTALGESRDPEAVRALLARYFERMRGIVEAHGGTVQKFIGDAVVAIFGVPAVHEDDALRALRAADEMRTALPELGVEARFGVNTGEVVTSADDTLVTGDAVNVAARLQQAAGPGEVLVGAATLALAGAAVETEEIPPLKLKGKAEPVAAYRLVSAGEAPERAHGRGSWAGRPSSRCFAAPGRVPRPASLRARDGRRRAGRRQVEAGCGAPRCARRPGRGGRCLSYGNGITYWAGRRGHPAARQAPRRSGCGGGDPLTARRERRGDNCRRDRLGVPQAARAGLAAPRRVRRYPVGRGDVPRSRRARWALLDRPSILVVCMARPELAELRPQWPVALRLEPLRPQTSTRSSPGSVPAGLRARIARASGGNPLFVTEMVAMSAAGDRRLRCRGPEGAARRAARPARGLRAGRARARRGRGRALPPRGRAGARPRDAVVPETGRAGAQGTDPARAAAAAGRGRFPLLPPSDSRRSLRRAPEDNPRRAPRAVRPLARRKRARSRGARRNRRLSPGTGRRLLRELGRPEEEIRPARRARRLPSRGGRAQSPCTWRPRSCLAAWSSVP